MDNTKELTHISLCAGYGGIDLGLKRVIPTLRTVAFCEVEAFAVANLVAKMEAGLLDAAPIWSNLKTFPWSDFRDRVDLLSGGYPCQPFSNAGQRRGADDERHLWPFIANGIRLLRPRLCLFENVEGHITLGLSSVVSDLEQLGYNVSWGLFSASVDAGAPHQRKRVFILAHRSGEGLQGREWLRKAGAQGASGGYVAQCGRYLWPSRPSEPQFGWEPPRVVCRQTEPEVGGDVDGATSGVGYAELCVTSDNRTDELRLLGNGVVPATAERAFRVLMQEQKMFMRQGERCV